MRVLVCGGRDFINRKLLYETLDELNIEFIISGGARGADLLAVEWANNMFIDYVVYPADWDKFKRSAGPIRNRQMLVEAKPDLVVAFPGGVGTANMIKQAQKAGIEVIIVAP